MAVSTSSERTYPGNISFAPTPANTDIANAGLWRGLYVNAAAAVTANLVLAEDPIGSPGILWNLQPGAMLPISVRQVRTGGTAVAGDIILVR